MEDGLLSLKWNNHRTTFFHILSNLRKKQTYTDATIACDGKFFPVHKLVMSTCSDYFSEIFDRTPCKAPVVVLKDIRSADLEALLDYMYLGEVDVKQSDLAGLIKAAECLKIKGLAVPDEDPSTNKKSHVPERQHTPPPKRRRRSSGLDEYSHSKGSSRSHSPLNSSSRSHTSTSVPSQSAGSADPLSQVPSYSEQRHSSAQQLEPEVVNVDMIKVEVDDDVSETGPQDSLLDHSSADDPGDSNTMESSGHPDDKKEQLANSFGEFIDTTREIEKEEHDDQVDAYNGSEQLAGPSGVQEGSSSMMQWGEDEGSFPHNLFGSEDQSQQQQQVFETLEQQDFLRAGLMKDKLHTCNFCEKGFLYKAELQRHLRIHTGEKPYCCSYCSHRTNQSSSLNKHIRILHFDMCLPCDQCSYLAVHQYDLSRHKTVKHFNLPHK